LKARGWSKKKFDEKAPDVDQAFKNVLQDYTAGGPVDEKVKWNSLSRSDITKAAVTERILAHLKIAAPSTELVMLPEDRAPPPKARLGTPG
jgi:hypothetical protein